MNNRFTNTVPTAGRAATKLDGVAINTVHVTGATSPEGSNYQMTTIHTVTNTFQVAGEAAITTSIKAGGSLTAILDQAEWDFDLTGQARKDLERDGYITWTIDGGPDDEWATGYETITLESNVLIDLNLKEAA